MWFYFWCYFLLKVLTSAEVITLIRNNSITCVLSEDSVYSALELVPYIKANRTVDEIKEGNLSDWDECTDSKCLSDFDEVTDQRWESFNSRQGIKLRNNWQKFSACIDPPFNFNVTNDYKNSKTFNFTNITNYTNQPYCQWFHFMARINENKTMELSHSDGSKYNYTSSFDINWFYVGDKYKDNMKVHDYNFYYSKNKSMVDSYVDINSSLCIHMFVSVDEHSTLDIRLDVHNKTIINRPITGFNKENQLKIWKEIHIKSNYSEPGKLFFFRRTVKSDRGFWAIDNIEMCRSKTEIYHTNGNYSDRHICRTLNNNTENISTTFSSKVATLLEKSNVSCASVLGEDYPYCEHHMICLPNRDCLCAWGSRGEACDKTCAQGNWGLNCTSTCGQNCENCDPVKGCTKCKENFFGSQCNVLQRKPTLQNIAGEKLTFSQELEYDENETEELNFYQIQYKDVTESIFHNYGAPYPLNKQKNITFTIENVLKKTSSYEVRLSLQNLTYNDKIPYVLINKKFFTGTYSAEDHKIQLNWNKLCETIDDYMLRYTCQTGVCSNTGRRYEYMNISDTTTEIPNLRNISTCSIDLYATVGNKFQLIDHTDVNVHLNLSKLIKEVSFTEKELVMTLESCDNFSTPLTYHLSYQCISKWCTDQNIKTEEIQLNNFTVNVRKTIGNLIPFTDYSLNISATGSNQNGYISKFKVTTPSAKPPPVKNLSVYCELNNTLRIKWKEPYPPNGKVESYQIKYNDIVEDISYETCELWPDYICANITKNGNQTHHNSTITVQAKNYNVTETSDVRPTKAFQALENFYVNYSEANKIVLNLNWKYPYCTSKPQEKFYIQVNNEKEKNVTFNDSKGIYSTNITVEEGKMYKISVWGQGHSHRKAVINATIFHINSQFSSKPCVQWCLDNYCHLLIPYTNIPYDIFLIRDNEELRETDIVEKYKSLKQKSSQNKDQCIIDGNRKGGDHETIDRVIQNSTQNFKVYLVANDTTGTKIYPLQLGPNRKITRGYVNYIVIALCAVAAIIITFSITCFLCKRQKRQILEKENQPELHELGEIDTFMESQTVDKNDNEMWSKPIDLKDYENYLLSSLEDNPDDNRITQQFEAVPKLPLRNRKHGQLVENVHKNRYRNIVAYDDTRVILQNHEEGDYINANYVDGYATPNAFIATQAPLPSTVYDFWYMICQENVTTIIMLTAQRENGLVKSEQYWPECQTKCRYGKFLIENISEKIFPNYIHRRLEISCGYQTYCVQHFQYVTWPDHGVPLCTQGFTSFLGNIMKLTQEAPVVVHCNAGCGRTGTYILCDVMIRMAKKEQQVDLLKVLKKIRDQRPGLVSTVDQYIFVHFVVLEYFFRKDFSITVTKKFQNDVAKALDCTSLKLLQESLDKATEQFVKTRFKLNYQLTDEEKAKNRFPDILPGYSRIFLPIFSSNASNYINAVSVDCYRYPKKFIVTQQPLPNTVEDFWTLINEYDISTIVSLNRIIEDDVNCPRFWPTKGDNVWVLDNSLTISFLSRETGDIYNTIRVKISDTETNATIVNIIDVKQWERKSLVPLLIKNLIHVWKAVVSTSNQIVVTCYDGSTASGLFVALAFLFEKLNMDHICDVFSAVKTVRESRPQFVQCNEQLIFLYQAAVEYIREFSTYGNFH